MKLASKSVILIQFILLLTILNAATFVATGKTRADFISSAQQSSGPSFDLTRMPGFVDLIPSTEPVTLTLELRVGVTDSDGVSMVIGSYKRNSSSTWTNVSMMLDTATSNADDYAAWPLDYTIYEPSFVVIWDIKFYANDSLGQWSISNLHQMSVCRQGSAGTSIDEQTLLIMGSTVGFVAVIVLIVYLFHRQNR